MKTLAKSTLLFLSLLLSSCQTQDPGLSSQEKDLITAQISEVMDGYLDAFKQLDADQCISYMADDFSYLVSSNLTWTREDLKKNIELRAGYCTMTDLEYVVEDRFVGENLACEFGKFDYMMVTENKADTIYGKNRTMSVFTRDKEGNWKIKTWMSQDG